METPAVKSFKKRRRTQLLTILATILAATIILIGAGIIMGHASDAPTPADTTPTHALTHHPHPTG
ncbi:hypothetical protein [Corynebacterium aquilae]|uniref:Uncharacterized protein n=1 Tax=Corynebacterium aquilae DSM 44791 TaxID=1431546 RepID=A0A1L7CDL3_9CORY|nr:hypothetical protein [Corynebacterium aquilae]APT83935.1 hypothetical protein CAQU_01330 [Corynebacterium aquilae DSM 44791]